MIALKSLVHLLSNGGLKQVMEVGSEGRNERKDHQEEHNITVLQFLS